MSITLTAEGAKKSLSDHVAARGGEIHAMFGPHIGWRELVRILEERTCVRYPCEIIFDSAQLQPGEFAFPAPKGESPEDGFTIYVHPLLMTDLDRVPYAVLYHLVVVNYGEFASSEDAETFGAAVLGIDKETYYKALCDLSDELADTVGD